MIRSRSVHLRLLHSQCKPRNPEFTLWNFEQPRLNSDLKQASIEDERKERGVSIMGDTVILAICFPLVIVGLVSVLIWGMSAAGLRRTGYSQDESEGNHSRTV
jgi:hypothetical protein